MPLRWMSNAAGFLPAYFYLPGVTVNLALCSCTRRAIRDMQLDPRTEVGNFKHP